MLYVYVCDKLRKLKHDLRHFKYCTVSRGFTTVKVWLCNALYLIPLLLNHVEIWTNKQKNKDPLTLKVLSQEAEQRAVPSGDNRTLLTRFSWPYIVEMRVPFNTSHTFMA